MNDKSILSQLWDGILHVAAVIVGVCLLTAFLGMLFAPALEPFLMNDVKKIAAGEGVTTVADIENARSKLTMLRIGLWLTAAIGWSFLVITNLLYWRIII